MVKSYLTKNPSETKKLGENLAKQLLKPPKVPFLCTYRPGKKKKKALILALEGDLGGGKTTFLQGFAKGLEIKEKVLSPTFVIIKRFKIKDLRFKNFYHIDCYRIKKPREILDLGFKKIIQNPRNIVAIEWADRIKKIIPKNTTWFNFEFVNEKTRNITVRN